MKTYFSEGKLMKQFGNPPLSKKTHPPLSTNPPISEQFFHDPSLPGFQKQEPTPLILGVRKLCGDMWGFVIRCFENNDFK